MKKLSSLLLLLVTIQAWAQFEIKTDDDRLIANTITKSYVNAIHNLDDIQNIDKGFHPGFDLLIKKNNQLVKYPIYNWKESVRKKAMMKNEEPREITECKFIFIDVTGDAAIAKIDLLRGGDVIFTDYLSLYRFTDGWRIVSKTYHGHRNDEPKKK